jgi:mRNA interferase RelE/StbE
LAYHLVYHTDVEKVDLPRIDVKNKSMIKRAIEERLTTKPEVYGKPLQRTLKGYWKLRVGEYRVVFKLCGNELRIFGIIHRKRVYRDRGGEKNPCQAMPENDPPSLKLRRGMSGVALASYAGQATQGLRIFEVRSADA